MRRSIVAYRNGAPVKLTDVATVSDDAENVRQAAWMNDTPAVIVNIQRQPGANIICRGRPHQDTAAAAHRHAALVGSRSAS